MQFRCTLEAVAGHSSGSEVDFWHTQRHLLPTVAVYSIKPELEKRNLDTVFSLSRISFLYGPLKIFKLGGTDAAEFPQTIHVMFPFT